MVELLRSNDLVLISFVSALLRDAGIESIVLDMHTSMLEGSVNAIQRRVMVGDDELTTARALLTNADLAHVLDQPRGDRD